MNHVYLSAAAAAGTYLAIPQVAPSLSGLHQCCVAAAAGAAVYYGLKA